MKKIPLLILILLLWTSNCFAAAAACSTAGGGTGTCYLTATGAGTKDGTTLGNAQDITAHNGKTYAADDIILLYDDGGTFTTQLTPPTSGTSGHPIIYKAAPGEYPSLTGGTNSLSITKNYLEFQGFDFQTKGVIISAGGVAVYFKYCIFRNIVFRVAGTCQ